MRTTLAAVTLSGVVLATGLAAQRGIPPAEESGKGLLRMLSGDEQTRVGALMAIAAKNRPQWSTLVTRNATSRCLSLAAFDRSPVVREQARWALLAMRPLATHLIRSIDAIADQGGWAREIEKNARDMGLRALQMERPTPSASLAASVALWLTHKDIGPFAEAILIALGDRIGEAREDLEFDLRERPDSERVFPFLFDGRAALRSRALRALPRVEESPNQVLQELVWCLEDSSSHDEAVSTWNRLGERVQGCPPALLESWKSGRVEGATLATLCTGCSEGVRRQIAVAVLGQWRARSPEERQVASFDQALWRFVAAEFPDEVADEALAAIDSASADLAANVIYPLRTITSVLSRSARLRFLNGCAARFASCSVLLQVTVLDNAAHLGPEFVVLRSVVENSLHADDERLQAAAVHLAARLPGLSQDLADSWSSLVVQEKHQLRIAMMWHALVFGDRAVPLVAAGLEDPHRDVRRAAQAVAPTLPNLTPEECLSLLQAAKKGGIRPSAGFLTSSWSRMLTLAARVGVSPSGLDTAALDGTEQTSAYVRSALLARLSRLLGEDAYQLDRWLGVSPAVERMVRGASGPSDPSWPRWSAIWGSDEEFLDWLLRVERARADLSSAMTAAVLVHLANEADGTRRALAVDRLLERLDQEDPNVLLHLRLAKQTPEELLPRLRISFALADPADREQIEFLLERHAGLSPGGR